MLDFMEQVYVSRTACTLLIKSVRDVIHPAGPVIPPAPSDQRFQGYESMRNSCVRSAGKVFACSGRPQLPCLVEAYARERGLPDGMLPLVVATSLDGA